MANVLGESSSGTASKPKYSPDVFLSFAGKDVRHGFTAHLYTALHKKGIKTFRDDKTLRKGQPFAQELLEAIEETKISIIVLSERYWFSKWCLNELVKILEHVKKENQRVFPIFYKVEPSDVRDNTIFETAMKKLNEQQIGKKKPVFSAEQMKEWRSALLYVGSLEGYPLQEGHDESEFIERIVKDVSKLVPKRLAVDQHIVGLETRVEEVLSHFHMGSDNTVEILLIHGTGGIGKTTLAKALFNEIIDQFECASFLSNVSETSKQAAGGIESLQKKLLKEALGEDFDFGSDDAGAFKIKQLLCYKRILLILDDVDEKKQIEKLAGGREWFGFGSRIIITSRDIGLLNPKEVGTRSYKMEALNDMDALEYFCWNAFNNSRPPKCFENLSSRAIEYAKGLPLALKVVGSDLRGEDCAEWEKALDYYKKNQLQDILVILRRSYDRLDRNEKSIFLDIACFFKGKKKEYIEILLDCGRAITILSRKSLLTVEYGSLQMHDLIQQMGRQIVIQENAVPGQPKRLWHHEDIVEALAEDTGKKIVRGIILDSKNSLREKLSWKGTSFMKMKSLRFLMLTNETFPELPIHLPNNLSWLEWYEYPSATLPSDFNPNKLVVLDLPRSQISESAIKPLKGTYLSRLNLSLCFLLHEIPDMSGLPNIRELILSGCENLTKVDDSVGLCSKLVHLDLCSCTKLKIFPRKIKMPSLEYIDLRFCESLQYFPDIQGEINTLQSIELVWVSKIKKLPESMKNIISLKVLSLVSCPELEELPIFKLESLETLKILKCPRVSFRMQECDPRAINGPNLRQLSVIDCGLSDYDFDTILSCFPKLKCLQLYGNNFKFIPGFIEELVDLRELDVSYCRQLKKIRKLPVKLQKVTILGCESLNSESANILWSQACKDVHGLEILFDLPPTETSIPSGFYRLNNRGGIVSFQTDQKFPFAAFAFVCDHTLPWGYSSDDDAVRVFINGRLVNEKGPFTLKRGRAVLIDLRNCEKNMGLHAFLEHEQNDVDVGFKKWPLEWGEYLQVYGVPCRELQMNTSSIWFRNSPDPVSRVET